MPADAARDEVAARIRRAIAHHDPREVMMFGSLTFMVDGSIAVAARRGGALLVRIDPRRRAELLARPGVGPALIGPTRTMEANWIEVAAEAIADDESLAYWLEISLQRHHP